MITARLNRATLLTAFLLVAALNACPSPAVADIDAWGLRSDLFEAALPLRSGGGETVRPGDLRCGPADQPDPGDGPVSDWCANLPIRLVEPDGLFTVVVEKASLTMEVTGPGPVNYEYIVSNVGAAQLTNIVVLDNHVDAPPFCPFTALNPGEFGLCTATYTVTAVDILNGGSPVPGSGVLENVVDVFTGEGATAMAFLVIPYNVAPPPPPPPPPGDPLQLFPVSADLGSAVIGSPVSFSFTAAGGTPPYQFAAVDAPPGLAFSGGSGGLTLSGVPTALGDFAFGVGVADSSMPENTVERVYNLTVVTPLTLTPPPTTLPDAVIGQPYEFLFTIGGGQVPYQFSVSGVPAGMFMTQSGSTLRLAGSPAVIGSHTVQIAVADASSPPQSVVQSYPLEVIQDMRLLPADPVLPDAVTGISYDALFTIEGGVPPFAVAASGQPPGMDFLVDGRQVTLNGVTDQTGEFAIDIAVSDASMPPQTAEGSYSLRVVPQLRLLPAATELPLAQLGEPFEFAFTSEGGLAPVSLAGSGAPPGMQFAVANGQLTLAGVASEIGEYTVRVTAQDSAQPQQFVSRDYFLSVVLKLEIDPEVLPEGAVGADYLALLSVRNGVPPYTFEVSGMPPGLSLSANAVSGRPGQAGEFALLAAVTDANGNTGDRNYVLEVLGGGEVRLGGVLPDARLDTAYGYQLQAVGAEAPLGWSGGGGLPDGLDLSATGLVAGYSRESGDFSFSASVTAADGQSSSGDFVIRVVPEAPLNAEAAFPPGLVGEPYRSPIAVRGGEPPFECGLTEGSLPPGLELNGCDAGVAGVPDEAGSFPFRYGVIDSQSPALAAELEGVIQVAVATPIPEPGPPDLDFQPPYRIPVAETSLEAPGPGYADESLQGLAVDAWGNRYIAGFSYNGSDYDIRVMKYSSRGVLLWDQAFDSGDHDYGYGIAVSEAGQAVYASGYALVGNEYRAVILKYDLVGVAQWSVIHADSSQVTALYGLAADEGGVHGVGERYNGTRFDALVVRYSAAGNLVWQTTSPGASSRTAYAVVRTQCGEASCLAMGGSEGLNGASGWVETLNPESGLTSPLATLGGGSVVALRGTAAGLIAGGSTPGDDWLVTALGGSGQTLWSTTVSSGHRLRGLALGRGGYVYAAGSGNSGSDAIVVLLSPQGEFLGQSSFAEGVSAAFHGLGIGPQGRITAAGQSASATGNRFLLVDFNSGK